MQNSTFQEGVCQAARGSFTKGEGISHNVENPITVPRNHTTCLGMEPDPIHRPYQTGTSATNICFFYNTLLQQSMQKRKATVLNTSNQQIPAHKNPSTMYFGQQTFFLIPHTSNKNRLHSKNCLAGFTKCTPNSSTRKGKRKKNF